MWVDMNAKSRYASRFLAWLGGLMLMAQKRRRELNIGGRASEMLLCSFVLLIVLKEATMNLVLDLESVRSGWARPQ